MAVTVYAREGQFHSAEAVSSRMIYIEEKELQEIKLKCTSNNYLCAAVKDFVNIIVNPVYDKSIYSICRDNPYQGKIIWGLVLGRSY